MLTYDLSSMDVDQRAGLLSRKGVDLAGPLATAQKIVESVRAGGDDALLRCAREYDSFDGSKVKVSPEAIDSAMARVPQELLRALNMCKSRIEAYHSRQRLDPFEFDDGLGVFGQKVVPLDRVGVYVPGGSASYASSLLMACVPARVAGVEELVVCTPAKDGKVGDAVLAAAGICSVDEVYSVGGAHAVAAMAYGTESIRPVQKIVGPGGAVVSAAKLLVRTDCEIDFLAGPSEILIVADDGADPRVIAVEMLAQLEHDPLARAVLVTTSKPVLDESMRELRELMLSTPRSEIVRCSSEEGAAFILSASLEEAMRFSNDYAPEHLLVLTSSPGELLREVRSAGSVFLGPSSSVAFGDYCSGPNHILPTKRTASARSSLSTYDFLKVLPYQALTGPGASELAPTAERMASAEGLPGHAQAAAMRRKVVR